MDDKDRFKLFTFFFLTTKCTQGTLQFHICMCIFIIIIVNFTLIFCKCHCSIIIRGNLLRDVNGKFNDTMSLVIPIDENNQILYVSYGISIGKNTSSQQLSWMRSTKSFQLKIESPNEKEYKFMNMVIRKTTMMKQ